MEGRSELRFYQLSEEFRNTFGDCGIVCIGKDYNDPVFLTNDGRLEPVNEHIQGYHSLHMAVIKDQR